MLSLKTDKIGLFMLLLGWILLIHTLE